MITKYLSSECEKEYDIIIGAIAISLDSITNIFKRYYDDLIKKRVNTNRAKLKVRHPEKIIRTLGFFAEYLLRRDDVFTFLLCDPERKKVGFLTRAINCAEEILYGEKIGKIFKNIKRGDVFGHFLKCPVFIVEYSRKSKKFEQASSQIYELYGIYNNLVRNNLHVEWFNQCITSLDQKFLNLNPFASNTNEFTDKGGLAVIVLETLPNDLDSFMIYERFLVRKLKRGFIEPIRFPYIILSTRSELEEYKSKYSLVKQRYREIKHSIEKFTKKQKYKKHIALDNFSVK